MQADIFARRDTSFVLWRVPPSPIDAEAPRLVVGRLLLGAPITFEEIGRFDLAPVPDFDDLWARPAGECGLTDGEIYHYWFEVADARSADSTRRVLITDPMAFTVDWRLLGAGDVGETSGFPAAVVRAVGGRLVASDAGVDDSTGAGDAIPVSPASLASNNRLVLYELPTAWAQIGSAGEREVGAGTFRDVQALVDPGATGADFDVGVTRAGRSYLTELGVNGLELLPPADSAYARQWGYGTTNFLAPDYELGFASDYAWPMPNRDLRALVTACHDRGVRVFADVVMAFAQASPYLALAPADFFLRDPAASPNDPDAFNSRQGDQRARRDGFGSTLLRYARFVHGYDPLSGEARSYSPARQWMKTALARWMRDFQLDGLRLDSVENVANWDFIQEYRDLAHDLARERGPDASSRFLVVGEELQEPLELLTQRRLDGLWHERFKRYIRSALLGERADGEASFEATVRKAIDCRAFGYADLAQAIIYLTSHDVEGYRNERLFNFLRSNDVAREDIARRVKLAFACLLTAVGIPMILAGEEFADEHDQFDAEGHVTQRGGKQVDPVNFSRLDNDPWRRDVKEYVARLVALRTTNSALSVNDVEMIHANVAEDRRVLAWRRGRPGGDDVVVVVANFSDFRTANAGDPSAEYRVHGWPALPPGRRWREVTQQRDVPDEWAGREPLFPWEAKVYAAV